MTEQATAKAKRTHTVATGLGREERAAEASHPAAGIPIMQAVPQVAAKPAEKAGTDEVDYRSYERPTVQRRNVDPKNQASTNPNYLDIPAFLRRQAD